MNPQQSCCVFVGCTLSGAADHSLRLKRYVLGSSGLLFGFLSFSVIYLTVAPEPNSLRLQSNGKVTQKSRKSSQSTGVKMESSVSGTEMR